MPPLQAYFTNKELAMFPTRHAVQRYQQRVAPVTTAEAFRRLSQLAVSSKTRPTPRWWTPVEPAPGLLFAYPAGEPGVCLLVRDGAILTVFERGQCRIWATSDAMAQPGTGRRAPLRHPYQRPPAGSRELEAS